MKIQYNYSDLHTAPLLNQEGLARDFGNSLILAPHPDDETLGCGGMMALLHQSGAAVYVIFVTSGNASHPLSKEYPPNLLSRLREAEAIKACEHLHIHQECISFLNFPDSQLPYLANSEKTKAKISIETFITEKKITTVFTPWRRDPHGDHREVYTISKEVVDTLNPKPLLVEYPIWLWKNSTPEDWPFREEVNPFRLNISSVREEKRKAIFAHVSQTTKLITDDPTGFLLTKELLTPFMGDFEYFLIESKTDQENLPASYFDNLYTEKSDPWNFESSAYEQKKYTKTLEFLGDKKFENALELGCSIGVFTKKLAPRCTQLLAVDITEIALQKARERCQDLNQVTFKELDFSKDFPAGKFDLIVMAEVGYYLDNEKLHHLFAQYDKHLQNKGFLIMVHWTSYVPSYPQTGKEVHQKFIAHNESVGMYNLIERYVHENYELLLWQKETVKHTLSA